MDLIDTALILRREALPANIPVIISLRPRGRCWRVLGMALLWSCLVAACSTLGAPPFVPQTPDQQAIAQTLDTFLTALRQQNAATLRTTFTAEATVTTILEGTQLSTRPYHDIEQQYLRDSLLVGEPTAPLVNFQQAAPDRVTVETSLVGSPTIDVTQKKEIVWHLQRQQDGWRISAITEKSSTRDVHIRAYGAGS